MEKLLAGVRNFQKTGYVEHRELFERLARRQQNPIALFITCSDSRINPNLITGADPGDLFLVRNAGNLIPPYGTAAGGEIATIEYSIAVLGISNVIICGHSQCGAMQAMLQQGGLEELPAVQSWFRHAEATRRITRSKYANLTPEALHVAATQENVLVQMSNLSTHPYVAARLATGQLRIYGWYYDIGSGNVLQYEQASGEFRPLGDEPQHASLLPIRSNGSQVPA